MSVKKRQKIMLNIISASIFAYLLGSIPFSFILGKAMKGIDIRTTGSRNVGATNLMRCAGKFPGISALLLDVSKGIIAVTFVANIFYRQDLLIGEHFFKIIIGLFAVMGHVWTVFLGFKGGKGVATTIGVLAGLSPLAVASGIFVWLVFIAIFKYVSLSSIAMSVAMPAVMLFLGEPVEYIVLSFTLCVIIICRHYGNIMRIIKATEPRLGNAQMKQD
jgi:acyl phosphate:glycerol-3-phosphate acyltransferase